MGVVKFDFDQEITAGTVLALYKEVPNIQHFQRLIVKWAKAQLAVAAEAAAGGDDEADDGVETGDGE